MSGDHGYDPFGLAEPNPAMEAAVAEIDELQGELARLRAEKKALLAENNDLRREWLHAVSHDVVFTAEVNGEHGIDLSKMPISEATLAALNIGIDRENYRLRAECERLRTALGKIGARGRHTGTKQQYFLYSQKDMAEIAAAALKAEP